MNYPAAKQRGIRCHAGPEEPAPHRDAGASSLDLWIPAFAGMTTRRKRRGIKPSVFKKYIENRRPKGFGEYARKVDNRLGVQCSS